jgi:hypothetical protein
MRSHPYDIDGSPQDDFLSSLSDEEIELIPEIDAEILQFVLAHKVLISVCILSVTIVLIVGAAFI